MVSKRGGGGVHLTCSALRVCASGLAQLLGGQPQLPCTRQQCQGATQRAPCAAHVCDHAGFIAQV
jgi:hypothetical protein